MIASGFLSFISVWPRNFIFLANSFGASYFIKICPSNLLIFTVFGLNFCFFLVFDLKISVLFSVFSLEISSILYKWPPYFFFIFSSWPWNLLLRLLINFIVTFGWKAPSVTMPISTILGWSFFFDWKRNGRLVRRSRRNDKIRASKCINAEIKLLIQCYCLFLKKIITNYMGTNGNNDMT